MASWYWNTRTGWILLIKMVTLIVWWHVDNLVISMKFLFPCKNRSLTSFVLVSLQPWVSLSVVASFDFSGEVCVLKLEEALLLSWFSFELELSWDVTITGGNHIIAAQHWSLSNSDLCEAQTYPAQVCISFPCWSRKAPAVVSHLQLSGDGLTVLIQILSFAVRHNLYWILLLHCTSTKTKSSVVYLRGRGRERERVRARVGGRRSVPIFWLLTELSSDQGWVCSPSWATGIQWLEPSPMPCGVCMTRSGNQIQMIACGTRAFSSLG